MTEAQFQSKISKWMKVNAWGSFPYELKVVSGQTLNFNSFQPQQLPALKRCWKKILNFKITDGFLDAKPFDAFVFKKSPAYVGILFHKDDTKKRIAIFIHIKEIIKLQRSGAKSIKLDWAKDNGREVDFKNV